MYYLSACNSELFKSCYCCFIFAIRKILQNSLLSNIRNKCVKIKIKFFFLFSFLSFFFLFFLTLWKMAKFFLQMLVIFNMITDSFLVEKWGTLKRARRCVCKNLLNLDCRGIIIHFGIYQVAHKWKIIWEDFRLPIFCKILWYKLQMFVLKTSKFLILYFAAL